MIFLDRILDFFLTRLPIRFFKKNIISNINLVNSKTNKKVFLYYKTDPLFSKRLIQSRVHTNNYEIILMIKVLNNLGYSVDLVDREATISEIEKLFQNKYDLYIANAAGNSAKYHNQILDKIDAKFKVFYAAGPEPFESNKLVLNRHRNFDKRSGTKSIPRRIVAGKSFQDRFKDIDAIFYIGNDFSKKTYSKYKIPSFRMYPAIKSEYLSNNDNCFQNKNKNFLYFGGNGLICKGLDLIIEAFDGLNNVHLDICGPIDESDFWNYYKDTLDRNKNIKFHGFVKPSSKLFRSIIKKCAFNIFPGSAEGSATSVLVCMSFGLMTITTYETGIDFGPHVLKIKSTKIKDLKKLIIDATNMSATKYNQMHIERKKALLLYTKENYKKNFKDAIIKTTKMI